MEKNNKIKVSREVADFIKSYYATYINNKDSSKTIAIFWNDCKYISTDEDDVFEVVFPRNIHSELLNNRLSNE